ncbi:MAG: IucA/IucC family C-terminal-domain containing protein [Acidimicrobiales bacterium]
MSAPELVEGEAAVAHLVEAAARVRSEVSYLRAEVGDLAPLAERGQVPAEGTWLACGSFVSDPDWVEAVIRACGIRLGTSDPVVAASLFVQNYSYRVLALAVACMTTAVVVPDSAASSMAITLVGGRPAAVGYREPRALVLGDRRTSPAVALGDGTAAEAGCEYIVTRALDEHLAALVASTRERIKVGARLLWGNVAASAAVAFRTMEGCLGPWVVDLGEGFFERAPAELQGLGSFLVLEHAGRRGWFWERTSCCLYDRLPGGVVCGDCSRTPAAARRAAYLASLAAPTSSDT